MTALLKQRVWSACFLELCQGGRVRTLRCLESDLVEEAVVVDGCLVRFEAVARSRLVVAVVVGSHLLAVLVGHLAVVVARSCLVVVLVAHLERLVVVGMHLVVVLAVSVGRLAVAVVCSCRLVVLVGHPELDSRPVVVRLEPDSRLVVEVLGPAGS